MSISTLSKSIGWTRGLVEMRAQMLDLQRQFATGKKATTYGTLGSDRSLSVSMRARISQVKSYQGVIGTVQLRTNVLVQSFDRMRSILTDTRSDAIVPNFELVRGGQTALQVRAEAGLDELLGLLSSEVDGRYLFAGRSVDKNPVAATSSILDGYGQQAGFRQHLSERRQADLGADGLGRLVVPPATGGDLTVGEDTAGSPFGFKIAGVTSTLSGAAVTGPAGVPAEVSVSFAGQPQAGETIRLDLNLPDGTTTSVTLRAVAPGAGGEEGTFEIGADESGTAANLQQALAGALQGAAAVELSAASAYAAAEDFFNIDAANPPQRVDGPPFDTATGLRDGTEADTVFWYTGDAEATDPRATSAAKVDDHIAVGYGARANEEAFRWLVQNLAVLAADSYDPNVSTDRERYFATTQRTVTNIAYNGRQTIDAVYAQIASVQYVTGQADERHTTTKAMAEDLVAGVENADTNEVAVKLLQLQTRLEASYQVTSMLSQLSLTKFL